MPTTRTRRDVLVPAHVLEERLDALETQVRESAPWLGENDRGVLRPLWLLEEVRAAIRDAREHWEPTPIASRLTGWDQQTLRKYARMIARGRTPPGEWAALQVRQDPDGWAFLIASVPAKAGRAA